MALQVLEKELKNNKYSLKTDMGTYKNNAFSIMQNMMPTEYTGEIDVPDIYKSENGVWELQKTVDIFSGGILRVEPIGNGGCLLTCHLKILCTITPHSLYRVNIAKSDTVEEMAEYLRRYWCIPLKQSYEPIPDTLEKLHEWLRDYGASDIKVHKDGEMFKYNYRIDTHYPSNIAEKDYTGFAVYVKSIKEMAVWLTKQRYQLVRVWSPEEERDLIYEVKGDTLIEDEWISEKRGEQRFIVDEIVCRVLKQYDDGSYVLQDISYKTKRVNENIIKEAIKSGKLKVLDLQISEEDILIKKPVDLKKVCRPYGCGAEGKEPLSIEEQKVIVFYGLAYINSSITSEDKEKICNEIKETGSIDADELISMFTENDKWSYTRYCRLGTACSDAVIYLIYELA